MPFHSLIPATKSDILRIERKLDLLLSTISTLQKDNMAQTKSLQQIMDAVTAETTVEQSILTLVDELAANQNDPVLAQQILSQLQSNRAAMAASVLKNTTAAA